MGHSNPVRPAVAITIVLLVITSTICLQTSLPASVAGSAHTSRPWLLRRAQGEHVVLADCKDDNDVMSSQMAYYSGSVNATPHDVAVVQTPQGQSSLWVNSNTSAQFTSSGVTFSAVLGPKVDDGEYAGKGDNGYGDFSCWQDYQLNLYKVGNTTCSMVYDCDHRAAPETTASPSPTSTSTPQPGLEIGAIIGISIGAGVGAIVLAVAAFFFWRHLRSKKQSQVIGPESEVSKVQYPIAQPGWQPPPPFEMDSQRGLAEMNGEFLGELDGNQRAELGLPAEQARYGTHENQQSPR